jgi:hypothetical protein
MGFHGLVLGELHFLYVGDFHTSQETLLHATVAYYRGSFTFIYVDDVRTSQETPVGLHDLLLGELYVLRVNDVCTSQETHIWASTACYEDGFTFHT